MFSNIPFLKKKKTQTRKKIVPNTTRNVFSDDDSRKFKKRKKSQFKNNLKSLSYAFKKQNFKTISLVGIAFVAFAVVFLLVGPLLKVQTILVTRQDNIININQAYSSLEYIRDKNILFLDTGEIAARLQKSQNSIQNIGFNVKLPNSIEITLKAYPPVFQLTESLILENGSLLTKETTATYDVPMILLQGSNIEEDLSFGKNLNVSEIQKTKLLLSELQKNILGIEIDTIQYFTSEKEVLISDQNQTLYLFDINASVERQIEQLSIFQKESGSLNEKKYIYIDVRIPQKLYVCPIEEEFSCRGNIDTIYGESVLKSLNVPEEIS
ncbi:hypothetical protein GW846_05370 [Candidatus Gracilibacteria bacterium]|nr:hypothetical protein [Candidatus Gracilibacteria bacterium]